MEKLALLEWMRQANNMALLLFRIGGVGMPHWWRGDE
jgi:hypothetical protein